MTPYSLQLGKWLKGKIERWLGLDVLHLAQRRAEFKMDELLAQLANDKMEHSSFLQKESEKQAEKHAETLQAMQDQIDALGRDTTAPTPKAEAEEKSNVMPGFVRFSQRKRNWINEHRKPVMTSTGKQIEENNRLIASGQRKETPQQ